MGNLILDNGTVNNVLLYLVMEDMGYFDTVPVGTFYGTYITRQGKLYAVVNMSYGSQTTVETLWLEKQKETGSYLFADHKLIEL